MYSPNLSPKDIYDIKEMAKAKRREYDIGMGPLGDNIFKLIRKEGIHLILLPIETAEPYPFQGLYLSSKEHQENLIYIGLNTIDYYDKQIFTIAHELFHHWEHRRDYYVCRHTEGSDGIEEQKANRFAAEFLLPSDILESEIKSKNNGETSIKEWKYNALLRFIARIHCDYHLPYKAIVRRLQEIQAIIDEQAEMLRGESVRHDQTTYFKLGLNQNADMFRKLNTATKDVGIDGENLNQMIDVFEAEGVSLAELSEDLILFNKTLVDFNLEQEVDPDDLEELKMLIAEIKTDEG
jgi:Zn-dependent peptidase ImmA (M78 family)